MVKRYIWNVLITLDQTMNTILGGVPDETLSSRMGKKAQNGDKFSICFCKFLNVFQKDHCAKSIERDEGAQL